MQNIFEFGILQNYKKCANQSINQTAYVRRGVYQPHCAVVVIRFFVMLNNTETKSRRNLLLEAWFPASVVNSNPCHSVTRFSTLFIKKIHLDSIWTGKNRFCAIYRFCEDIRENSRKNMVINYTETMSAWSLTTRKPCPSGYWLCWHCINEVNDYADMCQRSQQLRVQLWHGKLFYFGRRKT